MVNTFLSSEKETTKYAYMVLKRSHVQNISFRQQKNKVQKRESLHNSSFKKRKIIKFVHCDLGQADRDCFGELPRL